MAKLRAEAMGCSEGSSEKLLKLLSGNLKNSHVHTCAVQQTSDQDVVDVLQIRREFLWRRCVLYRFYVEPQLSCWFSDIKDERSLQGRFVLREPTSWDRWRRCFASEDPTIPVDDDLNCSPKRQAFRQVGIDDV